MIKSMNNFNIYNAHNANKKRSRPGSSMTQNNRQSEPFFNSMKNNKFVRKSSKRPNHQQNTDFSNTIRNELYIPILNRNETNQSSDIFDFHMKQRIPRFTKKQQRNRRQAQERKSLKTADHTRAKNHIMPRSPAVYKSADEESVFQSKIDEEGFSHNQRIGTSNKRARSGSNSKNEPKIAFSPDSPNKGSQILDIRINQVDCL